jgi:hypothetical protein
MKTTMPQAAARERRLRNTALIGRISDRKARASRTNVRSTTKASTYRLSVAFEAS